MRKKLIFIVGPTASGKTDVALCLAKRLDAEIVSCDAMQVYKEISILTAKPSAQALRSVKHHLINTISVSEDFDVSIFRTKVLAAIKTIERKKKIPLIVGGSGLYMAILLDGIFKEKRNSSYALVRQRIEQEIKEFGLEAVYARLQRVDPAAAFKIHVHDARRIIRALEVYETQGKPISVLKQKRKGLWSTHDVAAFVISFDRDVLYARINARVEQMFASGAVDEIQKISKKSISQTALGIIGLKEIRQVLGGKITQAQAKEIIQRNTRRYAKRQLTWLRKDPRLTWVKAGAMEDADQIADKILDILRKARRDD
ncbi:MAG TPA: tRNA (adenosine(37)-N6)-dimethylallyltransferase MiaA [Candidatus Omnitrophota bacterium]|nr:tRNA (adenosine(37)-N6)-dimethylallyltransferase MiaA [Candidatus Omnitrophota bacterium]HQL41230.1 tRNA (adenosine(37)-N6)-dimethylallyltransferase MiaA [Candidatus Omnitrophota bacterium]